MAKQDLRKTGTPVYLRDLKPEHQEEFINTFKGELLKAYHDGEDIIVGYYLKLYEVEVEK